MLIFFKIFLTTVVLDLVLESSTSVSSSEQPVEKQTGSSLWNCFDTILQDMSTNGNCISAELDQFLSEPLISRQDDPASWWKMNMHRFPQLSPPLAEKFLAPPPTSVPSERLFRQLVILHLTTAVVFYPKMQTLINLLEAQQPTLGRVIFQLGL